MRTGRAGESAEARAAAGGQRAEALLAEAEKRSKGKKLKMCRPRARSRLAWVPPGVQVAFVVDDRPPVALVGVWMRRALVAAVI